MGYLSIIILFPRKDTFSGGFCPSMSGLKVKITRVAQNSIFISSRNTKFERNYFLIRKILMENSGNIKLINTWKFRENPKSKQFRTHPKNAPTGLASVLSARGWQISFLISFLRCCKCSLQLLKKAKYVFSAE